MVCHWHDFHTLFTPGRYIRSETEKIIHLKTQKVPNVSLSGVSAVLQLPPNARWNLSSKASKLSNGPSCSGRPSLTASLKLKPRGMTVPFLRKKTPVPNDIN